MKLALAVRSKVALFPVPPVIPGAAAWAEAASSRTTATISAESSRVSEFDFMLFIWLMAALLIAFPRGGIERATNVDFCHQPTEVLGIVRQVIEIGGVQIIGAVGRILRDIAGIENYIQ